jgi:hypothetical protein
MKCPYNDIGCWYIDDITHDCEATKSSDCRHKNSVSSGVDREPEKKRRYAYSRNKEGEE